MISAHIIGTRVSDTTAESTIVMARVIREFVEEPPHHVLHEEGEGDENPRSGRKPSARR